MVSGWTIFFGLLGAYLLVLSYVARRDEEEGVLKAAGPFLLWRTTRGRDLIDRIAGPKRFWRWWGDASIVATVAAGLLTLALLLFQVVILLDQPEQVARNSPEPVLLLGIPGVNPLIPIWYGLMALLVALVVHEGSHGIMSRASDLKVKSLGLLLFILPIGAFVEPDEEDLRKASTRDRNRVYSAGPMSNLVVGLAAAVLFSGALMGGVTVAAGGQGVGLAGVVADSPADEAGLQAGSVITHVGDRPVATSAGFSEALTAPQHGDGARGAGYAFDGHEDALRTPADDPVDVSIVRDAALGAWVRPDARQEAPLVALAAPTGEDAPACTDLRLSLVPADDGTIVRLDRGSNRLEARFDADWPSNWTRVAASAGGTSTPAAFLGEAWKPLLEAGSNPHACEDLPAGYQAWVGAGPGGFLDGDADEARVWDGAPSRQGVADVLDRPYQGDGEPSRNASGPARLLGPEVVALQMDEDDVNRPEVGRTADASAGDRHAQLVGPRAGDEVLVTLQRDGETRTAAVTLADKHAYYEREAPDANRESYRGAGFLGVSVVPLDRVEAFRAMLAQPLDQGVAGVFFYISYPFLVFTQQLDLLNAPLNGFFEVAGPAAALGGGFWVAANSLYWVFWINLMLGTFNALPAGPLDGGQMLRETLKDVLYRSYGVDDEDLTYEHGEDEGVQVHARDPDVQRKVDRADALVSRTMWTVGLTILGLILLPVMAPHIVPLIP